MSDKRETELLMLPEGRVINASLFEKDQFDEAAKPRYNIELAFDPDDVEGAGTIEDKLLEYAVDKWGDGAEDDYFNDKIRSPLLDGDKMAARREKKGKPGDAYKGKLVIRAHTFFNLDGNDAPGGIQVWDENTKAITIMSQAKIYSGMYGVAGVTIGDYMGKDQDGDEVPSLMFYLGGFKKTGDGERLVTTKDTSTLFKAVGRKKGDTAKRKTRKG
ncbi:MAG: ssDNA-binding protein [Acidiferrobacterales bacterium]